MTQIAYSATALEKVASLTNINPDDGKIIAASKFASGLPLKVSVAAFAAFEFVVRTASLIVASPLYFLANKTFTDMTDTTKSAAKTVLDATAALATVHAAEKKEAPSTPAAPKTIRDRLNDALAFALDKGNAALATVQKNPGTTAAVVASTLTVIALYYSYPSILSYLQGANDESVVNTAAPVIHPDMLKSLESSDMYAAHEAYITGAKRGINTATQTASAGKTIVDTGVQAVNGTATQAASAGKTIVDTGVQAVNGTATQAAAAPQLVLSDIVGPKGGTSVLNGASVLNKQDVVFVSKDQSPVKGPANLVSQVGGYLTSLQASISKYLSS